MVCNICDIEGDVFILLENRYREGRGLLYNKAILIANFIAFHSAEFVWVFLIIPFKLFFVDNPWGDVVSLCSAVDYGSKYSSVNSNGYFKVSAVILLGSHKKFLIGSSRVFHRLFC